MRFFILALATLAFGCSSGESKAVTPANDSGVVDAPVDTPSDSSVVDKAANCAKESELGTELTNSFGRADGVITAVVGPTVTKCALPNSDHVVLQMKMNGAIYRMVINVASTRGDDLRVRFATIDHAAIAPAWSEGWHTGFGLDYVMALGVHTTDSIFTPYEMLPLAEKIEDALEIGKPVSVYAWSSGGASAHKVHRNGSNGDGAIVLDPTGAKPRFMLFHFADQSF